MATQARVAPRPAVRLRPAPPFEPPFDDELPGDAWMDPGQLALDLPAAPRVPAARPGAAAGPGRRTRAAAPATGTARRAPAAPARQPAEGTAPGAGPGAPPGTAAGAAAGARDGAAAGAAGDPRAALRRVVAATVEVLNGYRPAAHLRGLARPGAAAVVVGQVAAGARRVAAARCRRGPERAGRAADPVAVHKVWLSEPRPGAVEATVLLITGGRTWAMALRLEVHHQCWTATALRLI